MAKKKIKIKNPPMDFQTVSLLAFIFVASLFTGSIAFSENGIGMAAVNSYLYSSSITNSSSGLTAPKVNSSSYSIPTSGSTFSKDSTKNSDRLVPGTANRAYGNTTPVPTGVKKQ